MTSPPPLSNRSTPPEFGRFADVVMQFVNAAESLLKGQLSHSFIDGSDAQLDCAAISEHPGTQSKQTLLTLATQQVSAGVEQCDLLRGIGAVVGADLVVFAPFPLARTCVVIAAKARFILSADTRARRLQRYLNEELAALHDLPKPSDDDEQAADFRAFLADRTADYVAVGATAGLTLGARKKRRQREAPFLVRHDQDKSEVPPPETRLVKDLYRASGLKEDALAGLPYSLLSAATHGRFRQAGYARYAAAGPSVGGVSLAAVHVTIEDTAQSTFYAALATRIYLCALARYAGAPEELVLDKLAQPTADWFAVAHPDTAT